MTDRESPEAEPVVTRAHREQASVTLQDAGAATLRWIASGRVPLKAPFNDDLRRVALALATAEHNAKRSAWQAGAIAFCGLAGGDPDELATVLSKNPYKDPNA